MRYQSPLSMYVVWHKDFTEGPENAYGGAAYANFLYTSFCRDIQKPVGRGVGIPVYYRSAAYKDNHFQEIPFHESVRNAVVVLAESHMTNDPAYRDFVQCTLTRRDANTRVLFYTLDRFGTKVAPNQDRRLYTELHTLVGRTKEETFQKRSEKLYSHILHDLSRLLFDETPAFLSKENEHSGRKPPVQLFISYARKDGSHKANALRNYIVGTTTIDTFLDVHNVQIEEQIEPRIKNALNRNTALIVIQTDEYANREWCRNEVITAKTKGVPMVVVNDLKQGERRSFPYLGNVPTIRWDGNFQRIVDLAMVQILQRRFANMTNDLEVKNYEFLEKFHCTSLGHSPELFDFVTIRKNKHPIKPPIALYPDPPIGLVEINLLKEIDPGIQFITPVLLPMFNNQIDRR